MKWSNSFNDQTSNFCKKNLPVQTQQNKHWQKIFNLFKLANNKDTIAIPLINWHDNTKQYNAHSSKDSKHSTVPYQKISWGFSKSYKSNIFQKPPCKWGWMDGLLYFRVELYK